MFDDNNADDEADSTETMYHVVDKDDDIWWSTEDLTEAQGKASEYTRTDPDWAPYEVITAEEFDERMGEEPEEVEPIGTVREEADEAAGTTMTPHEFDDVQAEADALVDELQGQQDQGPYGFLARREPQPEPEEQHAVTKWSLGNHSTGSGPDEDQLDQMLDGLDPDVDADLRGVLEEAAQMVHADAVRDFECPRCGLTHGHGDDKHDIRSGFNVATKFADEMEFVPYCHCGVNEAAMLLDFYGYIGEQVFTDEDEKFGMVADAEPEEVEELIAAWQQTNDESEAVRLVSFPANETRAFLRRYRQVKGAADSAPISAETRREIADIRADIEEYVDEQ